MVAPRPELLLNLRRALLPVHHVKGRVQMGWFLWAVAVGAIGIMAFMAYSISNFPAPS
jgi:hypothetical protein